MPERITNKDYFPMLMALANENDGIDYTLSEGKPLEQFLAKRFNLSKPTVNALLLTWEKEGKIAMEKDILGLRKIHILSILPHQKKKNKVLVFLDFDNLQVNFGPMNLMETINNTLRQIGKEIGPIDHVYVFSPYHTVLSFGDSFYEADYRVFLCPRIKSKTNQSETVDTVDKILTEEARYLISRISGITHFLLGSGDKDFAPLLNEISRRGIDIGIIISDIQSLSADLIKLADKKPDGREKMIYVLSSSSSKKEEEN